MRSLNREMVGTRWYASALSRLSTTWMISSTKPSRPTNARNRLAGSTMVSSRAATCSRNSDGSLIKKCECLPAPSAPWRGPGTKQAGSAHLDSHDLEDPLEFSIAEKANVERAGALPIAQPDLGGQAFAQPILEIGDVRVAIGRGSFTAGGGAAGGRRLLHVRNQFLGLAHVQGMLDDPFRRKALLDRAAQTENHLGVADGQAAVAQVILPCGRELQQTQRIGHDRAAFANFAGDFLLAQLELFNEFRVTAGFFQRIEVFALEIFDQCQFQHRAVIGLAHEHRDFLEAQELRRAPPALAGDQFKLVIPLADHQRLDDALFLDRISEFAQRFGREILAGLRGPGTDSLQGDAPHLLGWVQGERWRSR